MSLPYFLLWCSLIMLFNLSGCSDDDELSGSTRETTSFLDYTIVFANQTEAQGLLQSSDEYTQQLGPFDLQSKTMNPAASGKTDYLHHAAQQARSWTSEEMDLLRTIIDSAESRIEALELSLHLPEEIVLIKSTLQEEGGAVGYTRQNFTVLDSRQ